MALGKPWAKVHLEGKETVMPVLILLVAVVAAAGVTIALAYVLGLNFVWLGLAAMLAALAVRRWV